jgi:hypothetical protein
MKRFILRIVIPLHYRNMIWYMAMERAEYFAGLAKVCPGCYTLNVEWWKEIAALFEPKNAKDE